MLRSASKTKLKISTKMSKIYEYGKSMASDKWHTNIKCLVLMSLVSGLFGGKCLGSNSVGIFCILWLLTLVVGNEIFIFIFNYNIQNKIRYIIYVTQSFPRSLTYIDSLLWNHRSEIHV